MKRSFVILLIVLLLCALPAGCETRKDFTPESVAEPTAVPEKPVTPEPTALPTEAPTEVPTEEPTTEPTEEPVAASDTRCSLNGEMEVMLPEPEPLWIPVFENITFLINGELMDSSQQLQPDEHILTAHCTVISTEACDIEWTCVVRYNDADWLTRTALVTVQEGENDVLIVIRADAPLEPGDYVVKLYEGETFLGGSSIEF